MLHLMGLLKMKLERHKTDHHLAVKKHIDDLAKKKYHDLLGNRALEMTVMFMASEGAYIEALEVYANYSFKTESRNGWANNPYADN